MFHTRFRPEQVHASVFVAQGAVIVGDVHLDEKASVWFGAVLRGDTEPIRIGAGTNIQDGAILHVDPGFPLSVGRDVTVGHGAVIHGAQVGDNTLIGIRSVLLNGVVVGENCIVGACSLLTQGKVFPPGMLIMGTPAKVVRPLTPEEIAQNRISAQTYVSRAQSFLRGDP
jgi:carbonic anhydrase/acetyltransferase-like protein (isoleucine patch superfamily)